MKTLDLVFVSSLGLTGLAFMISTQIKPDTGIATAQVPTPQATNTPSPTPAPTPQPTPAQQTITQGTVETVTPQVPADAPIQRDSWVAKALGESPEQINARLNPPVQEVAYQPNYAYEPVRQSYQTSYQPVAQYTANTSRRERGSGRVNRLVGNHASMPQPGENPIAYFQRSGREPVWAFGDDETWYPSAYGLPDRTTDKGRYRDRCLLFDTVCHRIFGNEWVPDPGSTPINNPDPTRNARRVKAVARFFGGAIQAANEQGY